MLSDDKGNYVYVINGKNEVERRPIKIGTVDDDGVTIAEGLSGRKRSCFRPVRSSTRDRRSSRNARPRAELDATEELSA